MAGTSTDRASLDSGALPQLQHSPLGGAPTQRGARRWIHWLAYVLMALLVLAGVLLALLHTGPARRYALAQVTSLLQQQNIVFDTDELSYNLLDLRLTLRNLSITSQTAPDLPPFARIDRLAVDLSLRELARRRYVVQSGELQGVAVHYVVAEDGRTNLPQPARDAEQPSQPVEYLIEQARLSTATIRYENRPQRIDVTLPVSSLEVRGDATRDTHDIRFAAAAGSAVLQDRRLTIDELTGAVALADNSLRIDSVHLVAEGAQAQVTGAISDFSDPQAQLQLRATVDGARASTIAQLPDPVTGTVQIEATVSGRLGAPDVAGTVRGTRLGYRNLSALSIETRAAYQAQAQRASFNGLKLVAPFGEVRGDGAVVLGGDGASSVNLTLAGIDAPSLLRAFEVPYVVASRVDGEVSGEWPGVRYLDATGRASVRLTALPSSGAQVIAVSGRVDASGQRGVIDASLSRVSAAGATLDGRVRVSETRALSGRTRLRVDNLAQTIRAVERVLGRAQGSLSPVPVSGVLTADATLGGTLDAPTAQATIAAPRLRVADAEALAVNARVAYQPALLQIQQAQVQWQAGTLDASGRVGLTGAQALDLQVRALALPVAEMLRAGNLGTLSVSGTLSADARVTGTVAQPVVTAALRVDDLVAYQEPLGVLTSEVRLANRQVTLPDLLLLKTQPDGNGRLTGRVTYHLDRQTYTADLQSSDLRLSQLTLPDGRQVRGSLQLRANGSGSIPLPVGSLTLQADDLLVDHYKVGRVTVDADVAGATATVTSRVPDYGLSLNSVTRLQAPYPTTLKALINDLQLASLPLELQTPVSGRLRARADASLDLATPATAQALVTIDAFEGAWNEQPFAMEAPSVLRYARERLFIDRLQLSAQDSRVLVRGELPLRTSGAPGAIELDARANLATLARYAPANSKWDGAGELTLTGVIRGTLQAVDPDLTLVLANGSLSTPQLTPAVTDVQVRTRLRDGEALVEQLSARWGTAELTATGRVPLEVMPTLPVDIPRRGGPATFTARVSNLDLAQVPGAPAGLTGTVALTADVSAARADLAALQGRITFPALQVAFNGLTLAQQQTTAIALARGLATIEQFTLTGSAGTLAARGSVGLTGERPLQVDVDGHLNIGALTFFTDAVRAEGDSTLQIAARGTLAAPDLNGAVVVKDATFVVDEPDVAAEGVRARIDLAGRRITLAELAGTLNGGSLGGGGFVELGTGGISDIALELTTDDVALDAPFDLRSLSDATITLSKRGDEFVVGGQITLDEGGLTGDINFDEGVLAALSARRSLDLTEKRNPLLERVRLNIDVDTASPLLVDNNLARAEVTADLRVIGTPYEPALSGRLTILEESEVTLNERRYEVERGVISFIGERRILPSFDLLLNTSARSYDISIAVTGTPGETETTLTSDPTLPEPDIMALLVTGRTLDEMRGEEFEIAREQVLSYLAGRVGSQLGRGLERATGLSTVRIEPNLIANEADPSARLTLGQEITDDLEVIYSTNLTDSNDQIWIAEYDVTRRFQTSGVRQSDNSYRFDFRHDVRIGGRPAPRRIPRVHPKVASVTIDGDGRLPAATLQSLFELESGDDFNFFAARDAVDELEETLEERGYLQSRVRVQRRAIDQQHMAVTLRVVAGPQVELVFEGATPPRKVVDEVRTQWRRGVFDSQRLDDGVDALRAWLMRDDYLQPRVEGSIEEVAADRRRVRFSIAPGARSARVTLVFEGVAGISPDVLDDIIEEQDLEKQLFTDPLQVTELLQRFYREQGYLTAAIAPPRYEFVGGDARVVLAVSEGPRLIVRDVAVSGNAVIPSATLLAELPVVPGDPFLPFAAENALDRLRDLYWRRGYNDIRSDYELTLDRNSGRIDVRFAVQEGLRSVIAGIAVEGNAEVSDRLITEQLELTPNEPLDLGALARSRRNLYDTSAFSIVDITREELPAVAGDKPLQLRVAVREVQPYQLRYGLSYDTERGLGGILDLSNHNSLGKARVVGFRSRYDARVREARGYVNQPALRYFPLQTIGNVYLREERNPENELTGRFNVDRRGASLQQERELRNAYVWSYGVRYERARTFDPLPGGTLDETVTVSPLTSTLTRETRDEVLDATRGSFSSHAFSYAPSWLGTDQPFLRYFGQYFHYFPLQGERRQRFTNEMLRPRLVFATGVRVGVARGFDAVVPRSERFFAGGSSSIRGLAQNAAGPIGPDAIPLGGDAMLVINNELRFPLVNIFDGVAFSDVGNVFPRVEDFSLTDLQTTVGFGLRARTRFFLLRGDYGVLLDPRVGERRSRVYFSLGQAF